MIILIITIITIFILMRTIIIMYTLATFNMINYQVFSDDWFAVPYVMLTCQVKLISFYQIYNFYAHVQGEFISAGFNLVYLLHTFWNFNCIVYMFVYLYVCMIVCSYVCMFV